MPIEFSSYEQGMDRIAREIPGMPRDRAVINRLLFFLSNELDEIYNRHLAPFGLNSTSFLALAMLLSGEQDQINPSQLSELLTASRTNITRLTDELVNAGWIARQPGAEDRRRIELSLTDSGRTLIRKALPSVWQLIEQQWQDFSADEIRELDRLLRKLQSGLQRFREET